MVSAPPLPVISTRVPSSCTVEEIEAFKALVLKGNEVTKEGLSDRIIRAEALVFAYMKGILIGVGALKKPADHYRLAVFNKSQVTLDTKDFCVELGWVFVEVNYRGQGISRILTQKLVEVADSHRIFATSRVDNEPMHRSLKKVGFTQVGCSYASEIGEHRIMLFVR